MQLYKRYVAVWHLNVRFNVNRRKDSLFLLCILCTLGMTRNTQVLPDKPDVYAHGRRDGGGDYDDSKGPWLTRGPPTPFKESLEMY